MRRLALALALGAAGCFDFDGLPDRCESFVPPKVDTPPGPNEPPRWLPGPSLPAALSQAGVTTQHDRIYVVGGSNSGRARDTTLSLSLGDTTWQHEEERLTTARRDFALVEDGEGHLLAIGGEGPGGSALKSVEHLEPGRGWSAAPDLPVARKAFAGAFSSEGAMVLGGRDDAGGFIDSILRLPVGATTWTVLPNTQMRSHFAATDGPDGNVYVVDSTDDNCRVTPDGASKHIAQLPMLRDQLGAVFAGDGRLYAVGGNGPSAQVDVWEDDGKPDGSWSTIASLQTARQNLGVALGGDGRIYAIGGSGTSGELASVEIYGPVLTPDPSEVDPGGTVTIHGSNFALNAEVKLQSGDGCALGATRSDGAGEFAIQVPMPKASNTYRIIAVDGRSRIPVSTRVSVR